MTRLATRHLFFPARDLGERSVGSVREVLELILVAVLTCVAADVVIRLLELRHFARAELRRSRRIVVAKQTNDGLQQATRQECFKEFIHLKPPPYFVRRLTDLNLLIVGFRYGRRCDAYHRSGIIMMQLSPHVKL